MKVTVYQHTEAPLIIENVVGIEVLDAGDGVAIISETDGRAEFSMDDVIKWEGANDDQR